MERGGWGREGGREVVRELMCVGGGGIADPGNEKAPAISLVRLSRIQLRLGPRTHTHIHREGASTRAYARAHACRAHIYTYTTFAR